MTYTKITPSYNDRRYGLPWLAFLTDSLNRGFKFIDWTGRPGDQGRFEFDAEPGSLLASGQKDERKGRGGVGGYWFASTTGELVQIESTTAGRLLRKTHDQRIAAMVADILMGGANA